MIARIGVVLLAASCAVSCVDRKPSLGSESAAPATASAPRPTPQRPVPPAPSVPGPKPAAATASRADKEQAVLALLAGKDSEKLPEVASDPGVALEPGLRDRLSPRVAPVRIRMEKPSVNGDLPQEVVRRMVRQRYGAVRLCHHAEGDPDLAGSVTVRFSIAADGKVSNAMVSKNDTGKKQLGECVAKVFREISFPKPQSPGAVNVEFPIVFNPPPPARQ